MRWIWHSTDVALTLALARRGRWRLWRSRSRALRMSEAESRGSMAMVRSASLMAARATWPGGLGAAGSTGSAAPSPSMRRGPRAQGGHGGRCCSGSGPAGSWLQRGQMRLAGLRRPNLEGNRGASQPRPCLLSALLLWGWVATSRCCCGSGGEGWFVAEVYAANSRLRKLQHP